MDPKHYESYKGTALCIEMHLVKIELSRATVFGQANEILILSLTRAYKAYTYKKISGG